MESIATLKEVATKAIWGTDESHQEPISGVNGDVSKGEPYDAGNMEPSELQTKDTAPDETGTAPVETETAQPSEAKPAENPTEVKGSSVTPGDSTKAQNDVRDPSDPATHHDKAVPKENVDDSGKGLDVGDNPVKLDGPGPRPLEVIAKEHGGDAALSGSSSDNVGDDKKQLPGDKADGLEREGSGKGELYVKSSGLKADGGDFDAAAPGAGREADRLLDEKGVHKDGANGGIVPNGHVDGHGEHANGSASPAKEKTSLKTKIKAKLHRHSATAST